MGRRRDWTMEDDERIRELTAAGLCRHAIAVRLGCTDITLDRRARAIDVPLDSYQKHWPAGEKQRTLSGRKPVCLV
jgi:hypothetical protein